MASRDDAVDFKFAITLSTSLRVVLRHTVQAAKGRTVAAVARRGRTRFESLHAFTVRVRYWDVGVFRLRAGGAFAVGAIGLVLVLGIAAGLIHSGAVFFALVASSLVGGGAAPLRRL